MRLVLYRCASIAVQLSSYGAHFELNIFSTKWADQVGQAGYRMPIEVNFTLVYSLTPLPEAALEDATVARAATVALAATAASSASAATEHDLHEGVLVPASVPSGDTSGNDEPDQESQNPGNVHLIRELNLSNTDVTYHF